MRNPSKILNIKFYKNNEKKLRTNVRKIWRKLKKNLTENIRKYALRQL